MPKLCPDPSFWPLESIFEKVDSKSAWADARSASFCCCYAAHGFYSQPVGGLGALQARQAPRAGRGGRASRGDGPLPFATGRKAPNGGGRRLWGVRGAGY